LHSLTLRVALAVMVAHHACTEAANAVPAPQTVGADQAPKPAVQPGSHTDGAPSSGPDTRAVRCQPSGVGYLKARLQGAIDAQLDWSNPDHQCTGAPRPDGNGLRLIYRGATPTGTPLLLVFGIGPLQAGSSARNVPVNLTVVREGGGDFYATRGADKCMLDTVQQVPVLGSQQRYHLMGRGYCVQPARSIRDDGAVLLSRFDVEAIVDYAL